MTITADQALGQLEVEVGRFVTMLRAADLDAPVPSCPGWAVRDLVVHLGDVHRWVVHVITTGNPDDPPPSAPLDDHAAMLDRYQRVADEMLDLLTATDPETPVWTFGARPRTAAFWRRRQAHEVAIHRWDLGAAAGLDVGYDPRLAEDGIDEVVTMIFPRQVRLGRMAPLVGGLGLEPDHSAQSWVLAGDGVEVRSRPDAVVAGPAAALLLLLWGRIDLTDERLRLTGSEAAAAAVLANRIVP